MITAPALALALLLTAAAPSTAAPSARHALVLGNNQGGPGRARLWFAETDAARFARDLTELGGFAAEDVELLQGGSLEQVRAATARIESRLAEERRGGASSLFVVYFSGHASAEGLELGRERFGFDELRDLMSRSSADARVAIVDACESGTLTQVKGAHAAPQVAFALPAELVKGVAYIASTAVGESAQESAAMGGSFFSVHLDAALRGAADADGDGRVTLAEAFRYTSSMTVAGTAATPSGPQHPTFDIRMAGRGDVVMTNLQRAQARLSLPGDGGDRFLLSSDRNLVAEAPGGTTLALAPGRYTVERRRGDAREVTEVELRFGEDRALPTLRAAPTLVARAKGGNAIVSLFAGGTLGSALVAGQTATPGLRIGTERVTASLTWRANIDYRSAGGNDRGLGYRLQSFGGRVGALLPLWNGAPRLRLGLSAGYEWNVQQLASGTRTSAGALILGPTAIASTYLGPLELGLELGVPLHLVRVDNQMDLRPRIEGAVLLGYAP